MSFHIGVCLCVCMRRWHSFKSGSCWIDMIRHSMTTVLNPDHVESTWFGTAWHMNHPSEAYETKKKSKHSVRNITEYSIKSGSCWIDMIRHSMTHEWPIRGTWIKKTLKHSIKNILEHSIKSGLCWIGMIWHSMTHESPIIEAYEINKNIEAESPILEAHETKKNIEWMTTYNSSVIELTWMFGSAYSRTLKLHSSSGVIVRNRLFQQKKPSWQIVVSLLLWQLLWCVPLIYMMFGLTSLWSLHSGWYTYTDLVGFHSFRNPALWRIVCIPTCHNTRVKRELSCKNVIEDEDDIGGHKLGHGE